MRTCDKISGALAMLSALLLLAGFVPRFLPSESSVGPIARVLDSLAPWLLVAAIFFALLTAVIGLRYIGGALSAFAALGLGLVFLEHRDLSLPLVPEVDHDVRILFFNVHHENASYSDRIVSEALGVDPDVLVFAEAGGMYPSFPRLRRSYEFVSQCGFEDCEILVASKIKPLRLWQLQLNPAWPERYAVAEIETRGRKRFFLAISHLAKPWLSGISEPEYEKLGAQYDWLAGPVVAVGDFNAAPWALPMRQLLRKTGMRAMRWPLATWPASAGRWGVPIDQVLVHEGARVVRITPFGDLQNSNHRGFVVDVALP